MKINKRLPRKLTPYLFEEILFVLVAAALIIGAGLLTYNTYKQNKESKPGEPQFSLSLPGSNTEGLI